MIGTFILSAVEPLIDRLLAHRTVGGVPRSELEWLAARTSKRELAAGDVLTGRGDPPMGMYVVLTGRLSLRVDRGAGLRTVMAWQAGDVTGMLPYSRLKAPPADVLADEPVTVLVLDREHIEPMIHACPALTAVCVHVMVDRARVFTSSDLLDEKMLSLGRLAAGLAHELNNPASAAARNASTLRAALGQLDRTTRAFCGLGLTDAQCVAVQRIRDGAAVYADELRDLTPMEKADREDALADWLDGRGLSSVESAPLASAGFAPADLDALAAIVSSRVDALLEQITAEQTVRQLTADIEMAALRIHDLVAAVKRFTYMDQAMVPAPLAIGQGLKDTITVLAAKARQKQVAVQFAADADLPMVEAFGGELNQVWTNLLDNAIDATPTGGRVSVSAARADGAVVVRVADSGPGIPADVQPRIFDPFFTTKGVGEGTGLGLDIARRLVLRHHGTIDFTTGASGTEFRVSLPMGGR